MEPVEKISHKLIHKHSFSVSKQTNRNNKYEEDDLTSAPGLHIESMSKYSPENSCHHRSHRSFLPLVLPARRKLSKIE